MILILASIIAVFLAGAVSGIFAMLVIGIHSEERRVLRNATASSSAGIASRRLLRTQTCDDLPARVKARR
ncbi:hypothetical protein GCM10009527_047430 [Actinomadura nitritigenes]|uniref:Uncharacterized protein n=1 Tax=Actinomadura nitritigenes TaxID=134602 RepID=A0ABS3QTH4_9ACTN|nr:hypothetical protein [Actinomadura nitritigenes]MBO2437278.1 hypothetical protein [Actinomadura nitritigenes]